MPSAVEAPKAKTPAPKGPDPAAAAQPSLLDDPAMAGVGEVSAGSGPDDAFLDLNLVDLMSADIKVVSAARGTSASLDEAPAVIEVITASDFRLWGYQTTAEALHHTLGFYSVTNHVFPEVGVRGTPGGLYGESGYLKVMIDGRAVPYRSNSGNWLGAGLVPLSAVKRIEVIRGPASAMYGADAFLGVVNVITYKGEELRGATVTPSLNVNFPRNESPAVGGGFDGAFGGKKGPVDVMVAAKYHQEDLSGLEIPSSSPAPSPKAYSDDVSSGQVLRSTAAYATVDFRLHEKVTWGLYGYFSLVERPGEFFTASQYSNGLDTLGRSRGTLFSRYQHTAGTVLKVEPTKKSSVKVDLRYFGGEPTERARIEGPPDPVYFGLTDTYHGGEAVIEGSWNIFKSLTAVIGTELTGFQLETPSSRRRLVADAPGFEAGDALDPVPGKNTIYNLGAFAQATYTPIKKYLTLTGGFRYDYNRFYKSQYSGRVAAVSNPWKSLTVKVMYGRAFRAPSPLTLFFSVPSQPGALLANPNLKPQYVDTIEGQVSYRYKGFLQISTGLAYNYLQDLVETVNTGSGQATRNVAEGSNLVWESQLKASYKSFVGGYANFEYNYSLVNRGENLYINRLSGSRSEIYPLYIARGGIFGQAPKVPLRLSANLMVIGPRRASAANALAASRQYTLDAYPLVGATLSTVGLEMIKGKETIVSATARNLLNHRGPDPGNGGVDYPLAPLSLIISLTQKL